MAKFPKNNRKGSGLMGIRQVQVKNLVVNGNFESTQYWSGGAYDTSIKKSGGRSYKLTGTTLIPETLANSSQLIPIIQNHIYYGRFCYIKQTQNVYGMQIYFPIAEPNMGWIASNNLANVWGLYSTVAIRSNWVSGNYTMRCDFDNANTAATMWIDEVMIIDLTASFGVGKEPPKIWCDNNITYFEGSGTLTLIEEFGIVTTCTPPAVEVWEPTKVEVSVGSTIDVMKKVYAVCGTCYSGQGIILGQNWDVAI